MRVAVCGSTADPHGRELISHGTALFPAACYRDDFFLEDVPCPWHWHDELEAVYNPHVDFARVYALANSHVLRLLREN